MSAEANGMEQEQSGDQEEERAEQFLSPSSKIPDPNGQEASTMSQPTAAAATGQGNSQESSQSGKPTKSKNPCLMCGKPCASGTIQCTICTMWCHRACTKLSKEAIKGLEVQAKETGQAYWACRSCLSFNHKFNAHMKETSRRQDVAKSRVDDNSRNIEEIRRLLEDTRKEMREQTNKTEGRPDGEDDGRRTEGKGVKKAESCDTWSTRARNWSYKPSGQNGDGQRGN